MRTPAYFSILLCITSCGVKDQFSPQHTMESSTDQNAVTGTSSRNELLEEMEKLNDLNSTIVKRANTLSRLCQDLENRSETFNNILATRSQTLELLLSQKTDLENQIKILDEQLTGKFGQLGQLKGERKGIERALNLLKDSDNRKSLKKRKKEISKEIKRKRSRQRDLQNELMESAFGSKKYNRFRRELNETFEDIQALGSELLGIENALANEANLNRSQLLERKSQIGSEISTLKSEINSLDNTVDSLKDIFVGILASIKELNPDGLQAVTVTSVCDNF